MHSALGPQFSHRYDSSDSMKDISGTYRDIVKFVCSSIARWKITHAPEVAVYAWSVILKHGTKLSLTSRIKLDLVKLINPHKELKIRRN